MPKVYDSWRKKMETLIERSKLKAVMSVNSEMILLYWKIGHDIMEKQDKLGWGAKIIKRLADDLRRKFPDDRGLSLTNLKLMR